MQLHANAKTTPKMRDLIVRRVSDQDWTYREAAEAAGVSVRTVAKWVAPVSGPRRRPASRMTARGRIATRARRPPRTIGAIIRSAAPGLAGLADRPTRGSPAIHGLRDSPRVGLGRAAVPTPPPQRYEWPHAGDLLHLDIKPLGRFGAIGHRIHGDRRRVARGAGWKDVHVAIDDATRRGLCGGLARLSAATPRRPFWRARSPGLPRHGIPIRRVMSDNGSGYVSRAFRAPVRRWPSATCGRGPIPRAPTARRSALFKRSSASGRTCAPIARRRDEPPRCLVG